MGEINNHGFSLLEMCKTHDLHILNGRVSGDPYGELTCYVARGCSLVDYTIAAADLFPVFDQFTILMKDDFTHLPQSFSMKSKIISKNCPDQNAGFNWKTKGEIQMDRTVS